jgi:ribosomal protein L10
MSKLRKEYLGQNIEQLFFDKNIPNIYFFSCVNLNNNEKKNLQKKLFENFFELKMIKNKISNKILQNNYLFKIFNIFTGPFFLVYNKKNNKLLDQKILKLFQKNSKFFFLGAKINKIIYTSNDMIYFSKVSDVTTLYSKLVYNTLATPTQKLNSKLSLPYTKLIFKLNLYKNSI